MRVVFFYFCFTVDHLWGGGFGRRRLSVVLYEVFVSFDVCVDRKKTAIVRQGVERLLLADDDTALKLVLFII